MSTHSSAYAAAEDVQSLAVIQGQHTTEIANLKKTDERIEKSLDEVGAKIDKLLYWIMGSLGAAVVGILVSLFRH